MAITPTNIVACGDSGQSLSLMTVQIPPPRPIYGAFENDITA